MKKSGGKRKGAGRKPVKIGTISTTQSNGYARIKTKDGWKRVDRLLVEEKLGRKLFNNEHVWHNDKNKQNNDINNLHVCLNKEYYWLKNYYIK